VETAPGVRDGFADLLLFFGGHFGFYLSDFGFYSGSFGFFFHSFHRVFAFLFF
jgi:hypothetical protein